MGGCGSTQHLGNIKDNHAMVLFMENPVKSPDAYDDTANPIKDLTKVTNVDKLRQPVKRRTFSEDDALPLGEVLRKRVKSRRFDMNALDDEDIL